jgi:predicted nuclease with RNAse H fold
VTSDWVANSEQRVEGKIPSGSLPERFVGIDVSADAAYVVVLGRDSRVLDCAVFADEMKAASAIGDATRVAIDAPDRPSTLPHLADATLPPKFQTARCAEIALRAAGFAVPWTTPPTESKIPPWMQYGFRLWSQFREDGHEPLEVYPYAIFRLLADVKLPKKSRWSGRWARIEALRRAGVDEASLPMWGHDGLDAAAAALVALLAASGNAPPRPMPAPH